MNLSYHIFSSGSIYRVTQISDLRMAGEPPALHQKNAGSILRGDPNRVIGFQPRADRGAQIAQLSKQRVELGVLSVAHHVQQLVAARAY
ncbi:MAG: hypothetical protein HZC40_10915 [Chloroflexi bacterium]|nr:hypothetical protein [Chloroflexota bacterium]